MRCGSAGEGERAPEEKETATGLLVHAPYKLWVPLDPLRGTAHIHIEHHRAVVPLYLCIFAGSRSRKTASSTIIITILP